MQNKSILTLIIGLVMGNAMGHLMSIGGTSEKNGSLAETGMANPISVIKATHLIYNNYKDMQSDSSISVTFGIDELNAYLIMAKTVGNSVRVYFGKYGPNITDIPNASWMGKRTLLLVPVKPDGSDYVNESANEMLNPFNEGNICPPPKCPGNTLYNTASNPSYDPNRAY